MSKSEPAPNLTGRAAWCFTALRPKFWKLDAAAVFPLGLWLIHWRVWTLSVAILGLVVMFLLDRSGLTPKAAMYRVMSALAGPVRPAVEVSALRRRAHY
ncbi:MAG: IcmT/TraK family protein [Deltaproteobacteria bacterium]|jgi:intracellular multiplication protein IcmT|nr:IcmT/TraK family protein [Deltaproteobacteria bacterium]